MKKKICFITGSRADYGLLRSLMQIIKDTDFFDLQIVATGMHLSPEFGLTYQLIEKDGFKIDEKVEILLSSDSPSSISKAMGLGLIGFSDIYNRLQSDLLVLLGDRFEILSAAIAAHNMCIPIAHIHGGEATFGAVDEAFRHSITKLSHLHFTSTEDYRKRVIQLGENPERVFNVGAIGIDEIIKNKLLTKKELNNVGINFQKHNLLVVYHPETLLRLKPEKLFNNILIELKNLKDTQFFFIYTNADSNGRAINYQIEKYVTKYPKNSQKFISIDRRTYLSLLKNVDAIVGNSSSGIIEAATLHKPAINIGNRQKGRVRAFNVIDCDYDTKSIQNGFKKVHNRSFIEKLRNIKNPYGDGNTSKKIFEILKKISYKNLIIKEFYNIKQ